MRCERVARPAIVRSHEVQLLTDCTRVQVMEMLVDAPSEVELTVSRVAILRKPAGAAAAKLAAPVLTIGGEEGGAQKVCSAYACRLLVIKVLSYGAVQR